MPEGKFNHIFNGHGQRWVLMRKTSQRKPSGEAAPWFANTEGVADSISGMGDGRRSCSLYSTAIEHGANSSEDKLLEVLASFDHLGKDAPSCLGLGKPVHLESDSSSAPTSKVHAHIPATGRQLDRDALYLEFVLGDLGSLGVAADQHGLGRDGKAPLPQ